MTTIAELLAARGCSPQCLTARDPRSACGCRCASQFHGVLARAVVGEPADGNTLERTGALTTTAT